MSEPEPRARRPQTRVGGMQAGHGLWQRRPEWGRLLVMALPWLPWARQGKAAAPREGPRVGLSFPSEACWPDGIPTPRTPPEAALEGLRESLQAPLSQAWVPVDIAVLKQLQASMAKLCRRISDLPPSSPRGGRSKGLLLTPPPGQ